ncbi:hypothetical protein [Methylobacterium nonmethylotrophicum]|uniref:Uncharacterized protein n=1 Tax=Methylobacterium nonmethylotrophicum TaxID=1141884 RepID=A0A4Z0NR78_9HYPH|nr:hypothetical protein [Methylobacterium nonmethylotrophicum]TGD99311.1 hypothetical protein EU555_12345 [Methylobacterium nonmethylotrophicum]
MRTRVREQVRPDMSAGQAQTPVRDTLNRRRAALLTAEDTALPGRMLVLLSRLHRSEMLPKAESEKAGA